jgi:hypothetical protein
MFRICLAALLLIGGGKTANYRPAGGPVDYGCACGAKARVNEGEPTPLHCGKSMNVTSTIHDRTEWTCSNINCGRKQWTDPDMPAPKCCDDKPMIRQ